MKKLFKYILTISAALTFLIISSQQINAAEKTVKLGVVGSDTDVWDSVKKRLKKEGIDLEYVKFSDYNQPNKALAAGDIDLNSFQTQIFLNNYNKEHKTTLTSIGNTVIAPMGTYSKKVTDLKKLKNKAVIAIPNDATNGGRALKLLATAGLIKLKKGSGDTPTVKDITENKKHLVIKSLDASQTARSLQSVDAAVINNGVAVDAGLTPKKDAIYLEKLNSASKPYVNVIAARKSDVDNKTYQKIVKAYQTEATKKVIAKTSKGGSVAAWEKFGTK